MRPEDPLPLDPTKLSANMLVAEVIMEPEVTPLLRIAKERGCQVHLGKPMLEQQLELMASFFKL